MAVEVIEPALRLAGVGKAFPGGVVANADISFAVAPGEIHALLGENGAGKSTLVKMIYGVLRPDAGRMTLDGAPFAPANPAEARARGVAMAFQHFSLFEALTVAENVAVGLSAAEARRGDLRARIAEVSARYGLAIEPGRAVGELSSGERQRVEIVRCLQGDPRLLILDEPTSVLTPQEAEALFGTLRALAAEGRSILYISHKLEEVRALCSNATVLRTGRVVARCDPRAESARSLAEMMLGGALKTPKREPAAPGPVRLELRALSLKSAEPFGVDLKDMFLAVRAGEIVGIAGIAGEGQSELMAALIGERLAPSAEAILLDGAGVGRLGPRARRTCGMGFAPEERLGHAAAPGMALWENAILSARPGGPLAARGIVRRGAAERFAADVIATLDVRTSGVAAPARSLSGGNLQKFVVGREIVQSPEVLVVAQPTWGVDAGAAAAIHAALLARARAGAAVLVISQDLDELLAIASRVAVIAEGRLSPARPVEELTAESLGLAMGGAARAAEAAYA